MDSEPSELEQELNSIHPHDFRHWRQSLVQTYIYEDPATGFSWVCTACYEMVRMGLVRARIPHERFCVRSTNFALTDEEVEARLEARRVQRARQRNLRLGGGDVVSGAGTSMELLQADLNGELVVPSPSEDMEDFEEDTSFNEESARIQHRA